MEESLKKLWAIFIKIWGKTSEEENKKLIHRGCPKNMPGILKEDEGNWMERRKELVGNGVSK